MNTMTVETKLISSRFLEIVVYRTCVYVYMYTYMYVIYIQKIYVHRYIHI
jgi:hypothetical protein